MERDVLKRSVVLWVLSRFLPGLMILNLCVCAGRSFAYASERGASGCRGVVVGSLGAEASA